MELLRTSAFEGQSNKRWSSRFVFPFGPAAMYEDLRFDAGGNASNDRRFFARTGELLYLMLSRATRGAHNALLNLEELEDCDIDRIRAQYQRLAGQARQALRDGSGGDTDTPETDGEDEAGSGPADQGRRSAG